MDNSPKTGKKKSFSAAASAAIEQNSESNKIFGGIADSTSGVKDPMADLLDRTSSFTIPDSKKETITKFTPPTPSVEVAVEDDAPEETGYEESFINKQNEKLHSVGGGKNNITNILSNDDDYDSPITNDTPSGFGASDDEPPISADRISARRTLVGRYTGKFINNFISTISVVAHEVFVSPKAAIKEHSELMAKLPQLSPTETARLQQLDAIIKDYTSVKSDFATRSQMSKDEVTELQNCITDIMDTEDVSIHPGWMIGIILVTTLIVNAFGIFMDRLSIRARYS